MKTDNICNRKCPPPLSGEVAYCCRWCSRERQSHVTDMNRHLWMEDKGFSGPDGCKLPRESMPKECLEYDCHEDEFIVWECAFRRLYWDGEQWMLASPDKSQGWVNVETPELMWTKLRRLIDVTE